MSGGYKVVNMDWNQSIPETFSTFAAAFKAQQETDTSMCIYYITKRENTCVWRPLWETLNFETGENVKQFRPYLNNKRKK